MTLIDDTFARLMAGGKKAFISVSCLATPGSSCLDPGCGLAAAPAVARTLPRVALICPD